MMSDPSAARIASTLSGPPATATRHPPRPPPLTAVPAGRRLAVLGLPAVLLARLPVLARLVATLRWVGHRRSRSDGVSVRVAPPGGGGPHSAPRSSRERVPDALFTRCPLVQYARFASDQAQIEAELEAMRRLGLPARRTDSVPGGLPPPSGPVLVRSA